MDLRRVEGGECKFVFSIVGIYRLFERKSHVVVAFLNEKIARLIVRRKIKEENDEEEPGW